MRHGEQFIELVSINYYNSEVLVVTLSSSNFLASYCIFPEVKPSIAKVLGEGGLCFLFCA